MKIYLDWIDDEDGSGDLMDLDWPEGCRLPVAGETLLVGIGSWVVRSVQWELQQAEWPDSAVLKVVSTPEPTEETP